MEPNKLTTKDYWASAQGEINIFLPKTNPLFLWLDNLIPNLHKKTVFEVGCYPGKFLYPFALKEYKVSGIDFIDDNILVADEFKKHGFNTGNFYCGDFFTIEIPEKFDVVTSFGFIEHFSNFQEVIEKQADLVEDNGFIIIEVPNFAGIFQLIPRFLFDNENLKRHNLKAMNPQVWAKVLEERGFEIISTEYIGGYELWFESLQNSALYLKSRWITTMVLNKLVKSFFKNNKKQYSGAIALVAKKRAK